MKSTFSFLILLLIITSAIAQKEDIEVFEKKEGSKVIVMARNTGNVEYAVTLDITATGMDVSPSIKVQTVIPAGFMKEMANLTPRPGENWEYGYQVSYVQTSANASAKTSSSPPDEKETVSPPMPSTAKPAPPAQPNTPPSNLSKANLVVFTKPGCSRCEFTKKQLTSKGIPYEEYSVASDSPEINNMWAGLRSSGFTGGSVTMPVVRSNGKYYYNIPDLQGFVDGLKK